MFATASPHDTAPVHGASHELERNGFRRGRIARKRVNRKQAEHAEAIPREAERAGAGRRIRFGGNASLATTGHGDASVAAARAAAA
jgi:hypothetical protein